MHGDHIEYLKIVHYCGLLLLLLGHVNMFLSRSMDGFRHIRKTAKSCCLSFRTEQLGSQGKNFHEILYLRIFQKSIQKKLLLKSKKITGTEHGGLNIFVKISHPIILKWGIFQTKLTGKIKSHVLCSVTFSRKS
jgi:hypothetical protein